MLSAFKSSNSNEMLPIRNPSLCLDSITLNATLPSWMGNTIPGRRHIVNRLGQIYSRKEKRNYDIRLPRNGKKRNKKPKEVSPTKYSFCFLFVFY